MWLERISQPAHDAARCPTCGGDVRRRAYGEMHAGSFISDGKRVDIRRTPPSEYSDPVYLDPVTQYFHGHLYRLWASERYLSRGGHRLHRDVWTMAFGTIPRGCHIHHRDGDIINNVLSNLECVPKSLHLSDAWRITKAEAIKTGEHFTEHARKKAAEWHRSEEGRLWHSRMANRTKGLIVRPRETKPCAFCGQPFQALISPRKLPHRYCTPNCKAAAYRARHAPDR